MLQVSSDETQRELFKSVVLENLYCDGNTSGGSSTAARESFIVSAGSEPPVRLNTVTGDEVPPGVGSMFASSSPHRSAVPGAVTAM